MGGCGAWSRLSEVGELKFKLSHLGGQPELCLSCPVCQREAAVTVPCGWGPLESILNGAE